MKLNRTKRGDGSEDLSKGRGLWALLLIACALSFNFVLCFVNTNISAVSNLHVIGCELVILSLTFLTGFSASSLAGLYCVAILVMYLTFLVLMRDVIAPGSADIKIVRDFLIPFAFFWLGKTVSLKDADRIVRWSAFLILGIGLFEYFFLDIFLKYWNVIGFYIARGSTADTERARLASGGLVVSGIRPQNQGRELLPWLLGSHRVSSIFLEPSSLGNFGIIVTLWGALRSKMQFTVWWGLLSMGLCCIILADTRFAAAFLALGILLIFLPPAFGTLLAGAMPFVAVLFLLIVVTPADMSANDTQGRLAYAALVIGDLDISNWIGLKESSLQTFDAGYGYLFSDVGVVGVLALWFCFMSLSGHNPYFYAMRNAAGGYLATLFLISQSQMTIKTASLLWLLMGAISVARVPEAGHIREGRSRKPDERIPGSRQPFGQGVVS